MKWIYKHIIKRIFLCYLWHGEHDWIRVSPYDITNKALYECKRCGKTKVE